MVQVDYQKCATTMKDKGHSNAAEVQAIADNMAKYLKLQCHHIYSLWTTLESADNEFDLRHGMLQCRGLADRVKAAEPALSAFFEDMATKMDALTDDGVWPQGVQLKQSRWPDDLISDKFDGTIWDEKRAEWLPKLKSSIMSNLRKDDRFMQDYGLAPPRGGWLEPMVDDRPPTAEELAAQAEKKRKAEFAALPDAITGPRKAACDMKFASLKMIFKQPFLQKNKTMMQREDDFIIMMRNMFAAMDPDLIGKEKELGMIQQLGPVQETKVSKDGQEEVTDEPKNLADKWGGNWNLFEKHENDPPNYERMMMVMGKIPSFATRCKAANLLLPFTDKVKMQTQIDNCLAICNNYVESFKLFCSDDAMTDLFKMLHGVLIVANYLNHRVTEPLTGLSATEKKKRAKEMLMMEDLDHYAKALTAYCTSKEWSDKNKQNSLPLYVAKYLKNEKLDMNKLTAARTLLKKTLEKGYFAVIRDMDKLQANYDDLRRIAGDIPPLDETQDLTVKPFPAGSNITDGFEPVLKKAVQEWSHIVPEFTKAKEELFDVSMRVSVLCLRNDTTADLKRYFEFDLKDPPKNEKGDAIPVCEKLLRSLYNTVDCSINALFEANKSLIYQM